MTDSSSLTATAPDRGRNAITWMLIGLVLVVTGVGGWLIQSAAVQAQKNALDPQLRGPTGTRALTEILQNNGLQLVVTRSHLDAARALQQGPATLVLPDAPALSDQAIQDLTAEANDVVLVQPRERTLRLLLPGAESAGFGSFDPVEPDCSLPEAQRSGAIAPGEVFTAAPGMQTCYPSGDSWGLIVSDGDQRISAIDGTVSLTNQHLAQDGNAALAINLMGRNPTVVWYIPSLADSDLDYTPPTLGELTPPWLTPVILILIGAAMAAAVWRGRRFGPLVAERLPVTVRASETTEGRGRLYANGADRTYALDQLRQGTLTRLSILLGLGTSARADEVVASVAARTGRHRDHLKAVLMDALVHTDQDLVSMRDQLRQIEQDTRRAARPGRNNTP